MQNGRGFAGQTHDVKHILPLQGLFLVVLIEFLGD